MVVDLSQPEKELLAGLLEKELEEIHTEFHHAQVHDYKESLKEREALVRGLRAKLAS